jgi:sortase (surface protein transpeptidase)
MKTTSGKSVSQNHPRIQTSKAARLVLALLVAVVSALVLPGSTAPAKGPELANPPEARVVNLANQPAEVRIGRTTPVTVDSGGVEPFNDVDPTTLVSATINGQTLTSSISPHPTVTVVLAPGRKELIAINETFTVEPQGSSAMRIVDLSQHRSAFDLRSLDKVFGLVPARKDNRVDPLISGWIPVPVGSQISITQKPSDYPVGEFPFTLEPGELATAFLVGGGEAPLRIAYTRDAVGVANVPTKPTVTGGLFPLTAAPGKKAQGSTNKQLLLQAAAIPDRIRIPSIGLDAPINEASISNGALEVPATGTNTNWFSGSPIPGNTGPAVITGHVSFGRIGGVPKPAVFARLKALQPGDRIEFTRKGVATATFTVLGIQTWPKENIDLQRVFGPVTRPELRLVTCGGVFNQSTGHHLDNLVVFARIAK